MSGCLFCGIVAGKVEASCVYEDDRTVAFMDIRPVNTGHTLVVPRRHATHLVDLNPDGGSAVFRTGRIAAALRGSGVGIEGINLWLADGEAAGQEVLHTQLHIVPRFTGDEFGLRFPPDYRIRDRRELEETAALIRAAL